jgi:hypothetical protein
MPAPKGNKYWEFREKHGREFKYTPEKLWEEAVMYFEWIEANPLKEEKGFAFQGKVTKESFNKMRPMTISGFCLFADICEKTFANYRDDKDFLQVITRIEQIIYTQKFEGAAADLLNPNIIARDLGLTDRHDHTSKGKELQGLTLKWGDNEIKV